jgi:PKD repeat protein
MESEAALARNILLALILSAVIIVIALLVVFMLFPPQPDVIPSFKATTERSGNIVYIYHDGGDPLQDRTTRITINGQEIPNNAITFLHGQDWPWTTGETIRMQYPGPTSPDIIQVRYLSGDTSVVLYTTGIGQPPFPTGETPAPTVPTSMPTISPTATVSIMTSPTTPSALPVTTGTTPPGGEPAARPPAAGFSAIPRSGDVPLTVQFTDRSAGSPDSWLWNFGDGGTGTEQNPSHQYQVTGIYTVGLTVKNSYGTSSKTETGYIAAGMIPSARFSGVPLEGSAPLSVQFNDLSEGDPTRWVWNFGDGTGSSAKNPTHLYTEAGEYTVSLTVTNQFGSNTRIQTAYVKATEVERTEVFISGSRTGYLLPDPYIQFLVIGPDAWIKIGGSDYRFADGDIVQLFPGDVANGVVDVNRNGITAVSFSDVRMFVNGKLVRVGIISYIRVPKFSGFTSTLSIIVPAGDSNAVIFADGTPVTTVSPITVTNLGPDAEGEMYLDKKTQDLTFRGGVEQFRVG